MTFADTMTELAGTLDILATIGRPLEIVIGFAAVALLATIVGPALERWRRPALAGLTTLLVLGEFVLIATNGGPNLWMGNHPGADGTYTALPDDAR